MDNNRKERIKKIMTRLDFNLFANAREKYLLEKLLENFIIVAPKMEAKRAQKLLDKVRAIKWI